MVIVVSKGFRRGRAGKRKFVGAGAKGRKGRGLAGQGKVSVKGKVGIGRLVKMLYELVVLKLQKEKLHFFKPVKRKWEDAFPYLVFTA